MKKIDLINQTFGCLTILGKDKDKQSRNAYWRAHCNICGAITSVQTCNLKRNPEHCRYCCYPNLVGKTFGYLTVLSLAGSDGLNRIYRCKCVCGKEIEATTNNLTAGNTKSCGCKTGQMVAEALREDLTGQQFGELTVIKSIGKKWLCKCSCGEYTEVEAHHLKNGDTKSCGHIRSKGELAISKFLIEHEIEHKKEYTFDDLPNRRFDFAIFNSQNQLYCVLEFMGIQHYSPQEDTYGWNTKENYKYITQHDEQKREYCRAHNIQLIEIPYWKYDNIDSILTELIQEIQDE